MAEIDTRLRAWRKLSGYTARECADLCGIPTPTWYAYEAGTIQPSREAKVQISRSLNVRIGKLFDPQQKGGAS